MVGSAINKCRCAIKQDIAIYIGIFVYIAITGLLAITSGFSTRFSVFIYPKSFLLIFFLLSVLTMIFYVLYVMLIVRPHRLFHYVFSQLANYFGSPLFVQGLLLFPAFCVFFSAMSSFKTLIPEFQAFSWDPAIAEFDRSLHGGTDPWVWLQLVVGSPLMSYILNIAYNLWLAVTIAALSWFLFLARDTQLRMQFLLVFLLCWTVNGTVLAVVFSSAGPAYFSQVYPDLVDPFQPLMAYLHQANNSYPIWALDTQGMLWKYYENSALGLGGGISSMPSMHVSIVFLVVLASWRYAILLRVFASLFLIAIIVGSVHLGWHYAVDAYLSMITTGLLWKGVGVIQARSRVGLVGGDSSAYVSSH